MIEHQNINPKEGGLSVRGKINSLFASLISGKEGVNALWEEFNDLLSNFASLRDTNNEQYGVLSQQVLNGIKYTESSVNDLLVYINGMNGGVSGFAIDTSFVPNFPEDKSATVLAAGAGTYTNMLDENGDPITITETDAITIFYKGANSTYWQHKSVYARAVTELVKSVKVEYFDNSRISGDSRLNSYVIFKFLDADGNQLFTAPLLGADDYYPGLLNLKNKHKLNNYADTFSQNPVASSESNGLMSAKDKIRLDSIGESEIIDLPWDDEVQGQDGYINNFTERGEYHIHGERLYADDGLPILNAASGHTIDGLMTVLDSSLPNGNKYDVCVTQILRLNNRVGGDGHIFVRTGIAATKSELQRSTAGGWSPWEKLMGVFEKNAVSTASDLNKYTSSGIYDGMFVFSSASQVFSGLKIESGSTFLMIAINGYAVAQTGVVPQVTQLLYVMPSGLDGSSGVRNAKLYTRTGIYVASTKTYTWGKFDGLAQASDIYNLASDIQEIYGLIQENQTAITANTQEIARVNSTATRAQEDAERAQEAAATAQTAAETAQTAATSAQETANSARETATAASNAAQEAKSAAGTAQSTATAAQTKNTEQDARLDNIEARIEPDIAGRVWNEENGTPKAESYYGSVKALRDLPKRLGLGRYIVKDDRTRRKLDPNDSHKYLDDGSTANLDGTDGQCMWCWNGFYANIWHEGSRLIKAVTFDGPVGNDISIWIPAGGISWLGAGVIDRGDAPYTDKTKWKLCSVINNSEQFRGGGGTALDASKYSKAPADTTPQITMLGMPAINISTTDFGTYARRRDEGWEANWFVARFVVEFLFEVIMGTENSQEAFNANKDANGLYQGGFGTGVTDMPDWGNYNGLYPVIPTSVGLEAGDGVCLVEYKLPQTNGVGGDTYKTFNLPVFFGLVGAGYGHLWQFVRGLIMNAGEEQSLVYVAPSMYAAYDPNIVTDKIMVAECPRVYGWIMRKSYKGLCCMPTAIGGSTNIRYSDYFYTSAETSKGLRVRAAGGYASDGAGAGASCAYAGDAAAYASAGCSAPLCYFEEDPLIDNISTMQ